MFHFQNISIIGSSHIAKQSIDEVQEFIIKEAPDIIALELDKKRFHALVSGHPKGKLHLKNILSIGFKGFLFQVIGAFIEKKLGKIVNVSPGDEMLAAIRLSQNKKLVLIDQDIDTTLRRFSQTFSFREKVNFIADLLQAFFSAKKTLKKYNIKSIDLTRVPDEKLIQKLIQAVKKRYPNIYKTLIQERDEFMSKNLAHLSKNAPDKKILAVVGAGHIAGIKRLLKKHHFSA